MLTGHLPELLVIVVPLVLVVGILWLVIRSAVKSGVKAARNDSSRRET